MVFKCFDTTRDRQFIATEYWLGKFGDCIYAEEKGWMEKVLTSALDMTSKRSIDESMKSDTNNDNNDI